MIRTGGKIQQSQSQQQQASQEQPSQKRSRRQLGRQDSDDEMSVDDRNDNISPHTGGGESTSNAHSTDSNRIIKEIVHYLLICNSRKIPIKGQDIRRNIRV